MYFVYLLVGIENRYYIGCTADVVERLERHNKGSVFSTKAYRPWKVLSFVQCDSMKNALKIERYLKSLKKRDAVLSWLENPRGRVAQLVRVLP